MSRLEELQKKNPQIRIYSVHDEEFLRYGRVVPVDTAEMCEMVLRTTEMPEKGSRYVTFLESIDTMPKADEYRALLCGQLDEQWGLCWGHNSFMNALEWHTCNEFNIGVTDLVLLLAKRGDLRDGRLDAAKVKAFYLPKGDMVEVFSDSLHFAPCEVSKDGFSCVVGLQRGTNEAVDPDLPKDPLVTAKNKWLICHESLTGMIEGGVVPGIFGENWEIHTI